MATRKLFPHLAAHRTHSTRDMSKLPHTPRSATSGLAAVVHPDLSSHSASNRVLEIYVIPASEAGDLSIGIFKFSTSAFHYRQHITSKRLKNIPWLLKVVITSINF